MTDDTAASRELSLTRFIAAPPQTVWQAMTDRIDEWWCPRPWRSTVIAQDRRPGGRCEMTMHGPDGEEMPQNGIYLAWDEGRRFISTDAITGDFQPAAPFMIGIWEIAPEGTGTRYTATARHWSAEDCARHAEMGFADGWMAAADQLAALCENP